MTATPVGLTPTQTREPGLTTVRTVIQTTIGILLAVGTVVPAAVLIIGDELAVWLPAEALTVLATVAAVSIAVSGITSRLMAIPAVNTWLDHVKLGAGHNDPYLASHYLDDDRDGIGDYQ